MRNPGCRRIIYHISILFLWGFVFIIASSLISFPFSLPVLPTNKPIFEVNYIIFQNPPSPLQDFSNYFSNLLIPSPTPLNASPYVPAISKNAQKRLSPFHWLTKLLSTKFTKQNSPTWTTTSDYNIVPTNYSTIPQDPHTTHHTSSTSSTYQRPTTQSSPSTVYY
jgi:hypothetical protein